MRGITVFDKYAQAYDRWFNANEHIYRAEEAALRRFIPLTGAGLEIGVGTGRFAVPLGVTIGVEPAKSVAQIARSRGIAVCQAMGEQLPFGDNQFDFALLVTVICFVADVPDLLWETRRVLKTGGRLVIAFIDKDSALGRLYESRKERDKFYREASFYSVAEVAQWTVKAGFGGLQFCQTIFGLPDKNPDALQVRDGYGAGAFVVLSALRI